ncbi:DUF1554 domain-containing protein [Leptospira barantonii]|uniref:DUF1554 domain-containing protein n=1 Tax=Leptospira barantonii TaxID=2023184 RepID=A0ABX4NN64_9LEPT|nr:DUF1554 domain-containing protein [Leptospira barantonii]PJZ58264.1 hypothetical protein CH367_07735 [Leptospira barantonii]
MIQKESIRISVSISAFLLLTFSCNEAERVSIDALKNPLIAIIEPSRFTNSSSSQSGTAPNCSTTKGPCYIFELYNIGGVLTNGNMGGIAGADTLCQNAAAALPSSFGAPSEYKALLMDESGVRDLSHNWVLYPNTRYLNIKKSTLNPNDSAIVFTTDSQAMYNGSATNSIIVDGTRPAGTYTFTGIRNDTPGSVGVWLPGELRTCFNWTSTALGTTYGSIGEPNQLSSFFIDRGYNSATSCNTTHGLYCVRQ